MASVKMKFCSNFLSVKGLELFLTLVVLYCCASCLPFANAIRFGESSRTLHLPVEKNHQLPSMTFFKDSFGFKAEKSEVPFANPVPHSSFREKRSPTVDIGKKLISVFNLNNSHELLSVHWAGKGSKVIICLARDRRQYEGNSSQTYISHDYGETFAEIQQKYMRLSAAKESLISMFYMSPVVNSRYIFTDTVHKYIFTTTDYGKSFKSVIVPFKPEIITLHQTDADIVLGMEKNDPLKKLWYSNDFGLTWKIISENVKSFIWGEKDVDPIGTLFVQRQEPGRTTSTIISSTTFFQNEQRKHIVISNVNDFEVRGKYLFATKRQHFFGSPNKNGTLQLWVSYNRKDFHVAQFPNSLEKEDFYIADSSEGQVFACVMHDRFVTNLYISNTEGTEFSLSLERILYFSPAGAGKDFWSSEESIVDLHKVEGLRGIYIATQVKKEYVSRLKDSSVLIGAEESDVDDGLSSLITFNKGGDWSPLHAPRIDSRGEAINCLPSSNCSLHVTQKFSKIYPRSRSTPIQSRASAPGLILASGVIGVSLKGHPSLFVSSDAGLNWHQVLYGNYLYSMADHGGLVVAVEYYNEKGFTDHIMYSIDEGEHWSPLPILSNPNDKEPTQLKIYSVMTEPGEKTTVFTLFGSDPNHHQWKIIKVDLKSVFDKNCGSEDYKRWSPHGFGKSCLLGRKDVYEKRVAHISCYNGEDYIRPVISENCPCSIEDYECDIGYVENHSKRCVRDPSSNSNLNRIPHPCPEDTFYNKTKGYRLVAGDVCVGREKSGYEPDVIPCPIKDETEFILFAQRQQISRIPLNADSSETSWEKLPLEDLKNIIAVDYDFRDRCVYWADIDDDKIMRLCLENPELSNNGMPEILVETALASVEGLAFDWVSRNLYFVDGELKKIEVIMVDLHNSGRMRRTILNDTQVDKPRGIALHPYKGYMFLTDWSDMRPKLARTNLDGSDMKILFDASVVTWPNGIAIDFMADRIYWVDAKRDYVASSDFDGHNIKKILEGSMVVPHPFAVGVYKDWVYFDDWNRREILMANKYDGTGIEIVAREVVGAMDMKVFSKIAMEGKLGTNICSNRTAAKCSHLCMAKPPLERVCLCPDGMIITKLADGNENCTCPDGETVLPNGTCSSVLSTCAPDQFKCSEKTCIPNTWKCDGDNDCGDNSDEINCGTNNCDTTQFQCKSGKCIPATWKCDIDPDCSDGSDEENCKYPACSSDQFSCKNGHCIAQKYVCDFDDDCRDNSDESNCTGPATATCQKSEFSCITSNGGVQCLPSSWRCDGESDCPDGLDEKNCSANTCQPWQSRCDNGRCIFATWKCDGENDCHDGSDEHGCPATTTISPKPTTDSSSTTPTGTCSSLMFTCSNKRCIPFWWRCDGVDDCNDNSDEELCFDVPTTPVANHSESSTAAPIENCGENRFRCDSGKCIWNSWVCDNAPDCPNGEDEKSCFDSVTCPEGHFRCERSSGCVLEKLVCNGKKDCGDGSDEFSCTTDGTKVTYTCTSNEFTCLSGECTNYSERCDGHWDCIDGSDEKDCSQSEIIHISHLEVDSKSRKPNGFNLTWSTPTSSIGNGTTFEYLPSYHEMHLLENQWTNTTWTDKNFQRLKNLVPGMDYKVTLFVRTKANPKKVYATETYVECTTLSLAPDPPTNVTLKQIPSQRTIQVKWQKPEHLNVKISQYKIYFSPPVPPNIVQVPSNRDSGFDVIYKFEPGTNYSFWVTACTNEDQLESMNSHVATIVFAKNAVIDPIRNLKVLSKSNNTISLSWDSPTSFQNASGEHSNSAANNLGYSISYQANYLLENYPWNVKNCTEKKITLDKLAPGAKYIINVTPYNELFMGPETRIEVTTDGKSLPIVSGIKHSVSGTNVTLTWNQTKDQRKADWEYGVFVVKTADSIPILLAKTKINSANLTDLDACVLYPLEVRVIGPFGQGSSKGYEMVETQFDKKAPPKNIKVITSSEEKNIANITWNAACPKIDEDIGYMLTIYDKTRNQIHTLYTKPSRQTELSQNYTTHMGAELEIVLQTNVSGSRPTEKLVFEVTPLPVPTQVDAIPEQNGSLYIRWKEVDWPKELTNHKFSYMVSVAHNEAMDDAKHYNISKPPFVIDLMEREIPYYVAVRVLDEHGYQSRLSEISTAAYPAMAEASVFSTSNVVSVVVPIVLVIVGLAGALGFYVMRHKRLQRSFMSFANSHYDTRSGSATFTTGQDDDQLDEDDSPMIRGFSDDEPLVIA